MSQRRSVGRRKSDVNIDAIVRALGDELRRQAGSTEHLPGSAKGVSAHFNLAQAVLLLHPQPCDCQPCALATVVILACCERSERSGVGFDQDLDEECPQEHPVLTLARDLQKALAQLQTVAGRLDSLIADRRRLQDRANEAAKTGVLRDYAAGTARLCRLVSVISELEGAEHVLLDGFGSVDLRQPFDRKPTQKVLAQWESRLARAGFKPERIADLVPDGRRVDPQRGRVVDPKQDLKRAAARLRKRAQRLGQ